MACCHKSKRGGNMARMAAGIRKRPDGSLEKRFTIAGKRYSVYGKTAQEIAQREQAAREQIKARTYTENRNITLDRYYSEWIERRRGTVKGNTLHTYKSIYDAHIAPAFGTRKVQSIERREVIAWQQAMNKSGNSAALCNYAMVVLHTILADACRDEIITRNPSDSIPKIKRDSEKAADTYHRALTAEEQAAFMDALRDNHYYTFAAMMLCTGMRCGEVAALQWDDIDSKNNVIHVRRTVTKTENGDFTTGTPKSAAGLRDIPITEQIQGILAAQRKALGSVIPFGMNNVFFSQQGTIVRPLVINNVIRATRKQLAAQGVQIAPFTSHAFRDTFATRYIEGGGNMNTLKVILGHSSLAMTADLYSHVLPSTKQQEMNSIHIAI